MQTPNGQTPIFVWRATVPPPLELDMEGRCIYCTGKLDDDWSGLTEATLATAAEAAERMEHGQKIARAYLAKNPNGFQEGLNYDPEDYYSPVRYRCRRCGWWIEAIRTGNIGVDRTFAGGLREFDINDRELLLAEISSHLAKTYSDVYNLAPRRFEELIAHVLQGTGLRTQITRQSRDGGIDIICFNSACGLVVVEVKRYAETRSVGIAIVDRLLGVRFRTQADEAILVTTSHFSAPALQAASQANQTESVLRLVDAHGLLHLLKSYSDPRLTVADLRMQFADRGV